MTQGTYNNHQFKVMGHHSFAAGPRLNLFSGSVPGSLPLKRDAERCDVGEELLKGRILLAQTPHTENAEGAFTTEQQGD